MDERGRQAPRMSGIRQIVRLKELVRRWHNITLNTRAYNSQHQDHQQGGIPPKVNRRLKNSSIMLDSDEESTHGRESPIDVPKGYLAVYVGQELRRFIIPTSYLSHHLFKKLLEKAEEEFGFDHGGGLTIPCEIETFKYLINCIEAENKQKAEENSEETFGAAGESSCTAD